MKIKRTAIVPRIYKDASYLTFCGGGSGGSTGSNGVCGGSGSNFSTSDIQKLLKNTKDKRKQEIKSQIREYKRQLEIKEEIRKQGVKIEEEVKQDLVQRHMVDPKILNTHSRKIPDRKERIFLCDMIETNPKEDNVIIKIIKNIGKKRPPKNMTIVQ